MAKIRGLLLTLVWLLPASRLKNAMLRALGHPVDPSAHAGSCIVLRVGLIEMAPHAMMRRWNIIKDLRTLSIGSYASVGAHNTMSCHPVYARTMPTGATLRLQDHAKVTSHHYIDCAGGVTLEPFASMAGRGSTVLTHAVDLRLDAQTAYPVTIGTRSFVSAGVMILGGAVLPPRSILAAGAVLTRPRQTPEPGLWAGVPARRVGEAGGKWFERSATHTRRIFIPATGEIIEDAF